MKRLLILMVAAVMAVGVMVQDVIYRTNYDTINAKIMTVNSSEVTYKMADYTDGPLFTLMVSEIAAIRYANGSMQYFNSTPMDEIPADEIPASQPLSILTRDGNTYFYAGEEMSPREMQEWFARRNCQAAYEQFRSARKMATAGWVFLGIGAAMDLGAAACIGVIAYNRYYNGGSTSNSNSGSKTIYASNRITALSENPNYTPNPLRDAAIGLTVGAIAFEAACIPLLVVGYHKMHSSVDIYNTECNTASAQSRQQMPYWTLQASGNGLGLALNF